VQEDAEVKKPRKSRAKVKQGRGRPALGKVKVTILFDPAVIAAFKADGPGWQTRINDTLLKVVTGAIRV
jgi:uncharacterized protein (DUF4415 family)